MQRFVRAVARTRVPTPAATPSAASSRAAFVFQSPSTPVSGLTLDIASSPVLGVARSTAPAHPLASAASASPAPGTSLRSPAAHSLASHPVVSIPSPCESAAGLSVSLTSPTAAAAAAEVDASSAIAAALASPLAGMHTPAMRTPTARAYAPSPSPRARAPLPLPLSRSRRTASAHGRFPSSASAASGAALASAAKAFALAGFAGPNAVPSVYFTSSATVAAPSTPTASEAVSSSSSSSAAAAAASGETEVDGLTLAHRWSELNQQGMTHLKEGTPSDLDSAEKCFREAALITAHVSSTLPYRALSLANLSSCLIRKGRCEDALHILTPLTSELRRHRAVSPAQIAMVHMECATAHEMVGGLDAAGKEINAAASVFMAAVERSIATIEDIAALSEASATSSATEEAEAAEKQSQLTSDALTAFRTSLSCRFRGAVLLHRQRLWAPAKNMLVGLALEYRTLIDLLTAQKAAPGVPLAAKVPSSSALSTGPAAGLCARLYLLPADVVSAMLEASAVDLVNVVLSLASVSVDTQQVSAACAAYEEAAKLALVHSPQNFMGVLGESSKTLRALAQRALPKGCPPPGASETYASVLKKYYEGEVEAAGQRPTEAAIRDAMGLGKHVKGLGESAVVAGLGDEGVEEVKEAMQAAQKATEASSKSAAKVEDSDDDDAIVFTRRARRPTTTAAAAHEKALETFFSRPTDAAPDGNSAAATASAGTANAAAPEDVMSLLLGSELADLAPLLSRPAADSAAAALRTLRRVDATRAFFGRLFAEYARKDAEDRAKAMAKADKDIESLPPEVRAMFEQHIGAFQRAKEEVDAETAAAAAAAAAAGDEKDEVKA